jgi:hypothetical protein
MTTTSPIVSFGLYNLEIRQDSTPSTTSGLQPFSKLADLRTGNVSGHPYATYEPDFWLLDGGYKFLPADPDLIHVGMMSLVMSNANGDFATAPVLTVDFSTPHSIESLTLHFSEYSGDYADSIKVQYYNAVPSLIREDNYSPTGTSFTTGQPCDSFSKIVLTFYSTNRPYRYLRVMRIDYGVLITFSGDGIRAASVLEDTDPISAELRENTFELQLYSGNAQFNILNPEGYYATLKERQPLSVYELVNGAPMFMGQYYLKDWKNTSDTEIEFHCIDLVGLMDDIPCHGGLWTGSGIAAGDLIDNLLTAAAIPYELDPALESITVVGWLPAGTLREALQQIAFAIGASVDCSRSWGVKIYKTKLASEESATATITKAQKGSEQSVELRPIYAGVDVLSHTYVAGTENLELFNGTLTAGTYEIIFSQPAHTLGVTGATITESGANYAKITVATAGIVTLTGKAYIDNQTTYRIDNPDVTGSIKTRLRIADATLVHSGNVVTVTQRIYDYHQQRYLQKLKLYASLLEVGQVVNVDTLYGSLIRGLVEKMDIDLAMGMVAQVEVIGVAV